MQLPLTFSASAITGAGRGKEMGIPTINVNLASVPLDLHDGVYAAYVKLDDDETQYKAAMHHGPRPVFQDSRACEVHLLDIAPSMKPSKVHIRVIEKLRDVKHFDSPDTLKDQIQNDIEACHSILDA